jgi:hypothetical protein
MAGVEVHPLAGAFVPVAVGEPPVVADGEFSCGRAVDPALSGLAVTTGTLTVAITPAVTAVATVTVVVTVAVTAGAAMTAGTAVAAGARLGGGGAGERHRRCHHDCQETFHRISFAGEQLWGARNYWRAFVPYCFSGPSVLICAPTGRV